MKRMNKIIKDIFVWIYLILSILLWVVVIAGADSIVENHLLGFFIAACLIDILIGKTRIVQDFLDEHSHE